MRKKTLTIEQIDEQIFNLRLQKEALIKHQKEVKLKEKKEMKELSKKLISELKVKKYSIEDLATIVGVSRQTVYRYGKGEISIDKQKQRLLNSLLLIN